MAPSEKAPPGHAKRVAWCLMATTSDGTNSLLAHIFWWGLSCGKIHILQHRCSSTFFGTIWSFTKVIVIMWYTIFKNTASSCFRCKLIYASQHRCSNTSTMIHSGKNWGIKYLGDELQSVWHVKFHCQYVHRVEGMNGRIMSIFHSNVICRNLYIF